MNNESNSIKVSVLIPVYGVEKYIERCARSLFEQTMREGIEFIFTNDCTPDNSIAILENLLDDYPDRKPQVRIIHHETNRGLAVFLINHGAFKINLLVQQLITWFRNHVVK